MNKKIIATSIFLIFFITFFQIPLNISAGELGNPEVVDDCPDTIIGYIDIKSAWFFENNLEPDYLYASMEIRNLFFSSLFGGLYQLQWKFNDIDYATFAVIGYKGSGLPKGLRAGEYGLGSNQDIFNMAECEGSIDIKSNIITWKIPKGNIGDLKIGDELIDPWAKSCFSGIFGFTSFIRFIPILGRDLAPTFTDENGTMRFEYGLSYKIQY